MSAISPKSNPTDSYGNMPPPPSKAEKRNGEELDSGRVGKAASRVLNFELPSPLLSSGFSPQGSLAASFARPPVEPVMAFPLPDFSCFQPRVQTVHPQLQKARDRKRGIVHEKEKTPCAPIKSSGAGQMCPFSQRLERELDLIKRWNVSKDPVEFDFGHNEIKRITHIGRLFAEGDFSKVYKCEVEGIGSCVLKLFYGNAKRRALSYTAHQLLVYAHNRSNPALSKFTPVFYNFEPHLEAAREILKSDPELHSDLAIEYVRRHAVSSVRLMPLIESEFPVDNWDPTDPVWKQLREFEMADRSNIQYPNDLLRDNIRIKDGNIYLIDLHEEWSTDDVKNIKEDRARSFTDDPKQIKWLFGQISDAEARREPVSP